MLVSKVVFSRPILTRGAAVPFMLAILLGAGLAHVPHAPLRAAQAQDYLLGTGDKVRLRVYEWRATLDQLFEWEALNGEFTVGQSGRISVPLLGEIAASGLSASELAGAVGQQMSAQLGIRFPPQVAVEISEHRPFYIIGAVNAPGAYAYRPGLTVLRALSIAGGLPRGIDPQLGQPGRDVIADRGALAQLLQKRTELLARKARLEAELGGAEEIAVPGDLASIEKRADVARALEQERGIFAARRNALASQIQTLNRLKAFLAEEVDSLRNQIGLKQQELESVRKELSGIETLVGKGLSPANRQFGLERVVSQLSSERLQMETALLRAQQELSRTDVEIDAARNRIVMEVSALLRTTEAELGETVTQLSTRRKLLRAATGAAAEMSSVEGEGSGNSAVYTIQRGAGGEAEEIAASETDEVLPGDIIKVRIPLSPLEAELIAGETAAIR